MKIFKRVNFIVLIASFCFLIMAIFSQPLLQASYTGIGEKRFEWDREIYDGVNLRHTMSYNQNKDQKTYTVTFNPKTAALKPVVAYGDYSMGGNRMSDLVNKVEAQGESVVFGFNGDAYDTSNGISLGIVINDGKLISSSGSTYGWGMTANGDVKYGNARLPMNFTANGNSVPIAHVNKERKQNTSGVYLMTEDFSAHTNSTEPGVEVVLNVDSGQDGLRIGQAYNLTVQNVVNVNANPNKNKTAIGLGKAVLATHSSSPHYNTLRNLTPGTNITVNVNDNSDSRIDWSEIVAGMGIFHLLLDNGMETSALSDTAVHPRTAMGVKADGTVVLMQNDGRQIGWATGFSFREMVEYMRDELGCVTVFNFDGGGSSTIMAKVPGDVKPSILNSPSDGRERSNTNSILFVATNNPISSKPVEKLHIYPSLEKNYATKGIILEKGKLSFNVAATDRNYYSVPLNSGDVSYRIENEINSIGTITSNGVLTAATGTGKGKVIASYGSLEAAFDVEVVNSITKIERDFTIISVGPGGKQNLDFRALKDGVQIIMSNESLDFELNPSSLGTISSSGLFSATTGQGTGNLKVSYKTFSLTIPVEVGRLPEMILDFEEDIFANNWILYKTGMPDKGGDGNISMNYDEDFIKHGDGSLRIDYDFKTNPLSSTVALEIGEQGNTVLEGQPTAIGAWVYGDGNGGWFRIQLTGGKYAGDTKVDWVGWKYIETPIPTDAPFPYTLQRAVRLLGTATIANNKKGTIYVDSVRAIYGFRNDDNINPKIDESSVYPQQGTITGDRQQPISLRTFDNETGIDRTRTQMYINGELVDNLQQVVNTDGSVDLVYNPSALTRLDLGTQNIKVRVEDNFGNKTFKEWSFTVTSSALNLNAELPSKEKIHAGEAFSYNVKADNAGTFTNLELDISYNQEGLVLEEIVAGSGVTISSQNINQAIGKASVILTGMNTVGGDLIDVVNFNFKAKNQVSGSTSIYVTEAKVTASGSTYNVTLPSYNVNFKHLYELTVEGLTLGSETTFTVTENGNPISGAEIVLNYNENVMPISGLTDSNGKLSTNALSGYPVGSTLSFHAIKAGVYSNIVNATIMSSSNLVTPIEGAAIRLKTQTSEQGLKFMATLKEGVKNNAHGFYLVYGETTISDLYNAINNKVGNDIIVNGKKVFDVVVPGVTEQNQFSVVLTGIPEIGYLDKISVIAYVEDAGQKHFAEVPIIRSVTEVALKMHAEHLGGNEITNILNASNLNARKYSKNAFGQYEITNGLYEINHLNLGKEFMKDWNAKFGTSFVELVGAEFFLSAKEGSPDSDSTNKNLALTNLYKFFNDTVYKDKWEWLLDFIESVDGTTHTSRQIVAVRGNGANGDYSLYNADHLSFSLINFFNQKHEVGGFTAINFTELHRYNNLKDFNFKIFLSAKDYEILKDGDVISVPEEIAALPGYEFESYQVGVQEVLPGSNYTVNGAVVFTPKFKTINYAIKYFDGNTEYTNLSRNYNIEDEFELPFVSKDNHLFLGWYDNAQLSGSATQTLLRGTINNKSYYAKWEIIEAGSYTIEYVLNGGELFAGFDNRDQMITKLLEEFHSFLNLSISVNDFIHGPGNTSGFNGSYNDHIADLRALNDKTINPGAGTFVNQVEYHKWVPVIDLMDQYTSFNPTQAGQFWSSNWTAKARFKEFIQKVNHWPALEEEVMAVINKIPESLSLREIPIIYDGSSGVIVLPIPTRAGKQFAGWYDNAEFTGVAITEISVGSTGNKNFYAKWS